VFVSLPTDSVYTYGTGPSFRVDNLVSLSLLPPATSKHRHYHIFWPSTTPLRLLEYTKQPRIANKPNLKLKKKASSLSRVPALSHCSANAAWLFYSSIFMKAIGYPLLVSRLTKSQLHKIQGSAVSISLNRMHFSKRTVWVLAYGPRYYGGLELGSLQTVQPGCR
jgi:hypothetical protein